MKTKTFTKRAILLIVILYSAIFWFDYKLKNTQSGRDTVQIPARPATDLNTSQPIFSVPANFSAPTKAFNGAASENQAELNEKVRSVLRKTENRQRFIENKGQLPAAVKYYSDNDGLKLLVTERKIRIISTKKSGNDQQQKGETHTVDLSFTGSNPLNPQPVAGNLVTYNYMMDEKNMHTNVQSYGELMLPGIYDGVSLRIYSNEQGSVEFDWLVSKPEEYKKIRMNFDGQDYLKTDKKGNLVVGLRFAEMKLDIPESYQVVGTEKKNLDFSFVTNESTAAFDLAENETLVAGAPLVIDPTIFGATFFDGGGSDGNCVFTSVATDNCGDLIAGGWKSSALTITPAYIAGSVGYDQSFVLTSSFNSIIIRISAEGKLTSFTFFGLGTIVNSIKIFPNNRILIGGGISTTIAPATPLPTTAGAFQGNPRPGGSLTYNGFVSVFSSDLVTLHYSSYLPGRGNVGIDVDQLGIGSVEILDDQNFFVSGIIQASNPTTQSMPAGFISAGAPDVAQGTTAGFSEVYIARFSGAGYNTLDWATYTGGVGIERQGGLEITPDKTLLTFCGETTSSANWPALTANNVGSAVTAGTSGLFLGALPTAQAVPAAFNFLSFFDGPGSDYNPQIAVSNNFYYIGFVTSSASLPGTAAAPAVFDATFAGLVDLGVTRIPINGTTSGIPVRTTYLGGTAQEYECAIKVDETLDEVYVIGVTFSSNFPAVNQAGSNYFKPLPAVGPTGFSDFSVSVFNSNLSQLKYSSFVGGQGHEFLGAPGTSNFYMTGDGNLDYDPVTRRLTVAGLVSDGGSESSNVPGYAPLLFPHNSFDSIKGPGFHRAGFIFSVLVGLDFDYGDVPAIYDGGTPARHNNTLNLKQTDYVRLGKLIDLETGPQPSANANGDDLNMGVVDVNVCNLTPAERTDEDAVVTPLPQIIAQNSGTYSVTVSAFKNTANAATPAFVYGWIDFNLNGVFELSERASASFTTNNTQTAVTLSWNLSNYSCGSGIISGNSYLRIRSGTIDAEVNTPVGTATNGEVEDYILSINAAVFDFGDLPVGFASPIANYTVASAVSLADNDPAKVWLGGNSDLPNTECSSNTDINALGDLNEHGLIYSGGVGINIPNTFLITLNSNTSTTAFYGVWFDWDRDGNFDLADFRSGSVAINGATSENITFTPPLNTVNNFAIRVIISSSVLNSSDFNIAGAANGEVEDYIYDGPILPATGFILKATKENSDIKLDWSTLQESNTRTFEVERSTDGVNFNTIGSLPAAGISTDLRTYRYTDRNVTFSPVFYRIKLVDMDAKKSYSNQVVVRITDQQQMVQVYPNPVVSSTFRLEFSRPGEFDIQLFNSTGLLMLRKQVKAVSGQLEEINRKSMVAGMYYLKVTDTKTGTASYNKIVMK
ncbi:MAG: GEVED domain-containing protein [Chitinophagaceae bacterium]